MPLFQSPKAFHISQAASGQAALNSFPLHNGSSLHDAGAQSYSSHPSFPYLALLVFEAVLEVVCVSLPGYILARVGMFDAKAQKFVANLNVTLFTPCLIFTKLASQLTAGKLVDLAIIPVIFAVLTTVSYLSSIFISRCFRFRKRQANFVTAMGVFANSNSLPISLVISLSKTLEGLHWDRIPNDNDDDVAARGILYLLIFQQLGQLLRWSWGYRVLLAPREQYHRDEEERAHARIGGEPEYSDQQTGTDEHTVIGSSAGHLTPSLSSSSGDESFSSGAQTPVEVHSPYAAKPQSHTGSDDSNDHPDSPHLVMPNGTFVARQASTGDIIRFPNVEAREEPAKSGGIERWARQRREDARTALDRSKGCINAKCKKTFASLPQPVQRSCRFISRTTKRFLYGVWEFMNPPLWAMLVAIIVASIPSLQSLFFTKDTFLNNSATRAIEQSGGVAVPLILVVLGANLERSTLPQEALEDQEEPREERNLIIASLLARMLIPTMIMGPILAVTAKFVPVSILDDPIFVIVCFLLTGAPSALQLAQICQINNVFMGAMSRVLFQSYVIWILPSTLILVLAALEVVKWATA